MYRSTATLHIERERCVRFSACDNIAYVDLSRITRSRIVYRVVTSVLQVIKQHKYRHRHRQGNGK